jgi:hypothetical protein
MPTLPVLAVLGGSEQGQAAKPGAQPTDETHTAAPDQLKDFGHEKTQKPSARTEFGVVRASCACKKCRFFCKVMPGDLSPADLDRLIPPGEDPLVWARVHLRAATHGQVLVPARTVPGGRCHWLTPDEHCAVHADAPFGCAMFHCKQADAEATRLNEGGATAIIEDQRRGGLYSKLCKALWEEGFRDNDLKDGRARAHSFFDKLRRQAERKLARARKKKIRAQKKKNAR